MNSPAAEFDEEQDIERFQQGGLDGKEVTCQDLVFVMVEEGAPGGAMLRPLWRRRYTVTLEHILNRRTPDAVAELAQLTLQLAVTPRPVLLGKPQNQGLEIIADAWPTPRRSVPERPFPPYQLSMPFQQGLGFEQEDDLAEPRAAVVRQRRQFPGKDKQWDFLPARDAGRTGMLPLQDTQLLAQQEDLYVFVTLGSARHGAKVEQK